MKQLVFLFALLLPIAGTAEPIFKWKDDQGVVHFSTTPPKEQINTEVMDKPELQKLSDDASQMSEDEERGESSVKKQAIIEADKEPLQKTKEDLAYCNTLRGNMTMLKSSPRVRVKNQDGEYEILDDAARQKEMARINKLLNDFCKN